jgi:hypothetical protein
MLKISAHVLFNSCFLARFSDPCGALTAVAEHVGPTNGLQCQRGAWKVERRCWHGFPKTIEAEEAGELLLIPVANGASFTFLFALPSSFLAHSLRLIPLRPIVLRDL